MYEEATQLVQDYGLDACPHRVADRAAFRHAAAEGETALEIEPDGKAADEVRQLYKWTCEHVHMQASTKRRASAGAEQDHCLHCAVAIPHQLRRRTRRGSEVLTSEPQSPMRH